MGQLRQLIVGELEAPAAEIPIGLETLTAALGPLTMTEKQAAWLETMRYPAAQAGPMLRVSPDTVEKVRGRAAELIRGHVDSWRRTLLTENGPALGREAAGGAVEDCLPTKAFLDVVDGRTTWRGREMMERHLRGCWHCVDHFCRMLEVVHLLRDSRASFGERCRSIAFVVGSGGAAADRLEAADRAGVAPGVGVRGGAGSCHSEEARVIQETVYSIERANLVSQHSEEEGRKPSAQHAAAAERAGAPAARQTAARLPADGDRQAVQPGIAGRAKIPGGQRDQQAPGLDVEPPGGRCFRRHHHSGHHLVLPDAAAFEGRPAADRRAAPQGAGTHRPFAGGLLRRE